MNTPETATDKRACTETPLAPTEYLRDEHENPSQRMGGQKRRQDALACAAQWNELHEIVGSFADEHTTL